MLERGREKVWSLCLFHDPARRKRAIIGATIHEARMLAPLAKELVENVCPPEHQSAVRDLLSQQCGSTLPGVGATPEWVELIDRVQLAAIRGSEWDLKKIEKAVALARNDWRDLLVGAGFGHSLSEHRHWQNRALKTKSIA